MTILKSRSWIRQTRKASQSSVSPCALTFEKDVSDGFVSYATLIRTPFSIEGAPDGLQEIFLRSEFFRDQKATGGEEYSFRSVQSALVVNCASREITENGFTRFEENETNGRAVYFVEGTTIYAEMAMASPSAGSMFESAMLAACDGQFMYSPSSSN